MLFRGLARGAAVRAPGVWALHSATGLRMARPSAFSAITEVRTLATESGAPAIEGTPDVPSSSAATANPHAPIRKFFEEQPINLGSNGMPLPIHTGRPWFARELRAKSFEDLHRLHFVLLVERNKLFNEKIRHRKTGRVFPSPERLKNIRQSMARLQTVLSERARESSFARWEAELKRFQAAEADPEAAIKEEEEAPINESQAKWRAARDRLRKPAKHQPRAVKASGGRKTKRKVNQAEQFARATDRYIDEIEYARDAEEELPPKPRWRNLSEEARRILREKQQTSRMLKQKRSAEQSKAARAANAAAAAAAASKET